MDELRDSYFKFGESKENVDGKLLEYHQLYCTVIKTFPQLSNYNLYNDIPCFAEFLNKVGGLDDKDHIKQIAKTFNEHYFLRHSVIVEKNKFIEELKNNFFEKWSGVYIDCKGKDKKAVIEEHFNTLLEKYPELNELYDKVQEYIFPIPERQLDNETLNLWKDALKNLND